MHYETIIPGITDRVVQAAVKIAIEPLFEAIFKDFSYGFRPRNSAHMALRDAYKWLNFKCHWVVDADLKSYFDTIPHDKLLLSVRSKVIDRSIVKLIEMWLKAGVMERRGFGGLVRYSTGWGNHAPYTKGNFEFERMVTGWRGIHTVLDLRLKK